MLIPITCAAHQVKLAYAIDINMILHSHSDVCGQLKMSVSQPKKTSSKENQSNIACAFDLTSQQLPFLL